MFVSIMKWIVGVLLSALPLFSQGFSNSSLNGKWFYRQVLVVTSANGAVTQSQALSAEITFNGTGGYSYQGGSGTYSVSPTGAFTLSNPLRANTTMNGRLSAAALTASSTETDGGVFDLAIAIPAASATTNASLNGTWSVAGMSGLFQMTATNGALSNNATYTMNADGTGTANFPNTGVITGQKTLYLSNDGNFLLMGSGQDIWVGIKALATNTTGSGLFWTGGLQLNGTTWNSHIGSANLTGSAGLMYMSRRVRAFEGATYFTGVSNYAQITLGAGGEAFIGSGNYELLFGFRAPAAAPVGQGPFLHPHGAVNGASFAPYGNPTSPGGMLTLFGANLAPRSGAFTTLPVPLQLEGVQVLINNRPAPLYAVSAGSINVLVPQATELGTANIVVNNNGTNSNTIQIEVTKTSPGIFSVPSGGAGIGAVLKLDYSLVSPTNMSKRGDTVQIFLNGLGATTPAVQDGQASTGLPLSLVNGTVNVYIGGVKAQVSFKGLAPGLAGVYQINAVIPASAPGGANVPVGIETEDGFHDQVNIAVVP